MIFGFVLVLVWRVFVIVVILFGIGVCYVINLFVIGCVIESLIVCNVWCLKLCNIWNSLGVVFLGGCGWLL